ncbi:MAG: hypothetical protein AAF830_08300 [Pseudomonadota bacterium]
MPASRDTPSSVLLRLSVSVVAASVAAGLPVAIRFQDIHYGALTAAFAGLLFLFIGVPMAWLIWTVSEIRWWGPPVVGFFLGSGLWLVSALISQDASAVVPGIGYGLCGALGSVAGWRAWCRLAPT